jgi:hypothetical protein
MASTREKLRLLIGTVHKAEEFVAAGGDLRSSAGTHIWMNLMGAFERVAEAFGYDVPKPVKKPSPGRVESPDS